MLSMAELTKFYDEDVNQFIETVSNNAQKNLAASRLLESYEK
jgi:hypothetical protein